MIHGITDILKDRVVGHDDVFPLETLLDLSVVGATDKEVDDAGQQVDLGQVEERVVNVDPLFAELDELVGVTLVNLFGSQKSKPMAGRQDVPEAVDCTTTVHEAF